MFFFESTYFVFRHDLQFLNPSLLPNRHCSSRITCLRNLGYACPRLHFPCLSTFHRFSLGSSWPKEKLEEVRGKKRSEYHKFAGTLMSIVSRHLIGIFGHLAWEQRMHLTGHLRPRIEVNNHRGKIFPIVNL